jgi:DNA-binding NtrC family response regulator
VIAATNCDLLRLVHRGDFREDLFYRLNVFSVQVPPLRERLDDIPLLTEFILHGRRRISAGALAKLQAYSFPGNVRELENIVESALYSRNAEIIEDRDIVLPGELTRGADLDLQIDNFWESIARPYANRQITRHHVEHLIRKGLIQTGGSYRRLVRLFNIPETDYKRFMDFLRRHRCNVDYRQYRKKQERPVR